MELGFSLEILKLLFSEIRKIRKEKSISDSNAVIMGGGQLTIFQFFPMAVFLATQIAQTFSPPKMLLCSLARISGSQRWFGYNDCSSLISS